MTTTSLLQQNPTLAQVEDQFSNVYAYGAVFDYSLDTFNPANGAIFDHVQGVAYYRNSHLDGSKVCDYFSLFSTNDQFDTTGSIIVCDLQNRTQAFYFDLDGHSGMDLNHPGGMQVIGDFLVIGKETQLGSSVQASEIVFYNLSGMAIDTPPAWLSYSIARLGKKAGAVGITRFTNQSGESRYLLAVYDNGDIDFYVSNSQFSFVDNPSDGAFELFANCTASQSGYSSINLVTEDSGNIYMVGFRSEDSDGSYADFADLLRISLDEDNQTASLIQVDSRHMYTEQSTIIGIEGIHFRYGAGIAFDENNKLNFVATQRNGTLGIFATNLFNQTSSVIRTKVYQKMAENQGSRVSDNFTLNDGREQIIWGFDGLNPDLTDEEIGAIRFDVVLDNKNANDKTLESNLYKGSITPGKLDSKHPSRMYIGNLTYNGKSKENAIKLLADPGTAESKDGYYFYVITQPVDDDNMSSNPAAS